MKNILKITFAFLVAIAVSSVPKLAAAAYNDTIYVEVVNSFRVSPYEFLNSINGVADAINAQTKAIKDAELQAHINALNPECVKQVTAQIQEKATDLRQINKMIDDLVNDTNTSDPQSRQASQAHINSLSTERGMIIQDYTNKLIAYCSQYTQPKVQETAPASSIQCNGKAWSQCPTGQNFYCPSTGDAQCLLNEPVIALEPIVKQSAAFVPTPTKMPVVQKVTPTPTLKAIPTAKPPENKDTEPTPAPVYHKGIIQNAWEWFSGLFGF